MKKQIFAVIAAMSLTTAIVAPTTSYASTNSSQSSDEVVNEKLGVPIVVYGGSLSESEKVSVKNSLGIANNSDVQKLQLQVQISQNTLKMGIQVHVYIHLLKLHQKMLALA